MTKQQKAMILELEANFCNVTEACKKVKIDRGTHYNWINDIPHYKKAYEDAKFGLVERAETILHTKVETDTTALLFFLKCKGGYSEKMRDTEDKEDIDWV